MSKAVVNELISVEIPDGFYTMTPEELRQAYQNEKQNRWGMWNKERHVMVTVMWKEYPWLMRLLLSDVKAICRKNEEMAGKGYAGHGYECGGFFSVNVDGKKAEGYRFSYLVGDVEQSAETILFWYEKNIFSVTIGGRKENREADRELFDRIIAGITLE